MSTQLSRITRTLVAQLLMLAAVVLAPSAAQAASIGWTQQFGGTGFDAARAIGVEGASLYALGATGSALPGQSFAGGSEDVFLRRYDMLGNEIWTRQFGTLGLDFPSAGQVAIDETGVYVAGFTDRAFPGETNAGGEDGFVRKFNFDGNVLWTDQFGTSCHDEPNGLAVTQESVFVVWDNATGGFSGSLASGVPGCDQSFIRRYSTTGQPDWTREFGGSGSDVLFGVDADKTGIYVGGEVTELPDFGGDWDAVVLKYDFSGDVVWARQFGTPAVEELEGVGVKRGALYVAGATFGTLEGSSAGGADIFVRKYDTDGNEAWTDQFGSPGNDNPSHNGVAVDANSVYVAGNVARALPGQTSAGSRDAFLRRYSSGGEPILTLQFGTAGDDRAIPVALGEDAAFLAGRTSGAFPGFTSGGGVDAFVTMIDLDD